MDEAIEWVKRVPVPDRRGRRRSRSARCSRRRTSATSSRPSCASRRSGCASQIDGARAERSSRSRMAASPTSIATIEAVWRIESARLIAGLARMVRDVGLAEDLAQEALVAALRAVARVGRPGQPGRLAHGHRQAPRDRPPAPRARCASASTRSWAASSRSAAPAASRDLAAELDDPFDDDLLRLIFTACHPVLSTEARVALTLRLLGGLTTDGDRPRLPRLRSRRSPSASSAPSARCRRRACRSRFPSAPSCAARLASVLEVVYLIFNEGYAATRRRRLDAPRAARGGAAARADPGRAAAATSRRSTAWSR